MICNQCGKNNPFGVKECTYCGTQMPATSACGGFEDIFSYQPPHDPAPQPAQPANPSPTMPPLHGFVSAPREPVGSKKTDNVQKIMFYGLIGLLAVVLILWVIMGNMSSELSNLKMASERIEELEMQNSEASEQIEELEKKLAEKPQSNEESKETWVLSRKAEEKVREELGNAEGKPLNVTDDTDFDGGPGRTSTNDATENFNQ